MLGKAERLQIVLISMVKKRTTNHVPYKQMDKLVRVTPRANNVRLSKICEK